MKVEETKIKDVKILTPLIHSDSRGSFFETFKSTFYTIWSTKILSRITKLDQTKMC